MYVTLLLCCTGQPDPPAAHEAAAAAAAEVEEAGKEQVATGKRKRDDAEVSAAGSSHRSRKSDAGEGLADTDQDKEHRGRTGGPSGARKQGEAEAEGEAEEEWDVTAGMNPRQKKLYLLQRKAAKARKANEHAAVAEAKRVRAGPPDSHLERKKWLDRQRKEKEVRF